MNLASASGGFRLHKIELYNWGTFDGQVHTVTPDGQTTLLIGQNGSGKSTLVDALLTLLVRPGVRNFNVAAGGKKTERDERSYLKGAYDRAGDNAGNGTQIMYLRPKGDHYSVILACFRNRETARVFTVAQLLYLGSDHSVEKVYCFAEDERSIREDFGSLDSFEGLLKTLRQRQFRVTKKFVEFEEWFTRVTRVKAKAMEVFNQTVAVKDIQRLNDFIRNHMLEPQDWSEKVDRLLGHFTQLSQAHQSLVRVRQQHDLLEPVARIGGDYRQQADALYKAERIMAAAGTFFLQKTVEIFTPELEKFESELDIAASAKQTLSQEMQLAQDESRRIQNEIEHAGGDRLKQIPLLIETERTRADAKRDRYNRFKELLARAEIKEMCEDEESFIAIGQWLPGLEQQLTGSLRQAEASRDDVIVQRGEVRRRLAENRQELEGLNQRRENLPEWCIALRKSLCHDLALPPKDLPFVAELIAVAPEYRDWEASIEKVLRNFAMSVLVPQRLYQLVSSYVERTRLTAQGRGQRLVYLQVGDQAPSDAGPLPDVASMVRKLVFREGHPLLPWVKAELNQRFDYRCCDTIEQFWECRGLALTRNRHVKSGNQRHDKDDRDQVVDSRNFILGWDNREKKLAIAAEIERLRQREAELESGIEAIETQLAFLRTRTASVTELLTIQTFAEINFRQHEEKIESLERERAAIEERSDTIRLLKEKRADVESRYRALLDGRDKVVEHEGELKTRISEARKLVANAKLDLENRKNRGEFEQDEDWFSEIDASFSKDPLNAEHFFESKDRFRTAQEQIVLRLRAETEPVKNRLVESMSRFMRAFPEETDLRAHADYLDSFLGLRQRIIDEDLPRHEQRFKERLNDKVIQEIGLFRGELERERRHIEDKIETLNLSLRRLEYRPGTHIQLEPRSVRDPEIVEFQVKLRECLEGSFEDSPEANEVRFLRIRDLIERLQDENNRRWRDKVTDVRRWFDFVATVIDRNSSKVLSAYEDSSGQSGGEKAKLAFTILVAAIAYQYDLDPEHPVNDRFHFVVVDEMFSKVDDQHAEYALELFKQFGLQLLIVAPLDAKARVTQPYVGCYLHVNKRDNRSEIFEMTAREFEATVHASTMNFAGEAQATRIA